MISTLICSFISVLLCGTRDPSPLICGQSRAKSDNRTRTQINTRAANMLYMKHSPSNRDDAFDKPQGQRNKYAFLQGCSAPPLNAVGFKSITNAQFTI